VSTAARWPAWAGRGYCHYTAGRRDGGCQADHLVAGIGGDEQASAGQDGATVGGGIGVLDA